MSAGVGLRMRRTISALIALLFASLAYAQSCNVAGVWSAGTGSGTTPVEAVVAQAAAANSEPGAAYTFSSAGACPVVLESPYITPCPMTSTPVRGIGCPSDGSCSPTSVIYYAQFQCPVGVVVVDGGGLKCSTSGPACATGCAATAGTHAVVNWTAGWARSSDPNREDFVGALASGPINTPDQLCDGQCLLNVTAAKAAFRSQVPAPNGLHRVSIDFETISTATSCTAKTPAIDPLSPAPPCPGTKGELNGKPVCFGTPTSPLPPVQSPAKPPEGYGNPAAGPQPSTGSGSGSGPGRTPASGDGGPAGGGSSAVIPGGGSDGNGQGTGTPTGTTGTGASTGGPSDQTPAKDPCGIPGGAPCKIDESGTPNGSGAFNGATSDLNAWGQSAVDGVNGAGSANGKDTSWGFGFSLPTGCTALDMGAYEFSLNVCEWQPVMHDLMSLVWIGATIWAIIGMVGRAIGGGSS